MFSTADYYILIGQYIMSIFDFIFGKKKGTFSNQQPVQGRCSTLPVSSNPLNNSRAASSCLEPFTFKSNQHQRYENGFPVLGVQECLRTLSVEKNINGCSGYQLKNGDGYIVRMINGDTGKPQMSAKPMRVVKSTTNEVTLRGYMVSAQTPFGFQEIDLSDYGLTVSLKDGKVVKCVLHMYDRNVDIEYRKVEMVSSTLNKQSEQVAPNIQKIIDLANSGLHCAVRNDIQGEWMNLAEMYNVVQGASGQLLDIPFQYCNTVASAFSLLLSHQEIRENEDIARAIADYAFYLFSKAIEYNPTESNLYQKRISLLADTRSFFYYTIANALEIPDPSPMDVPFMPLRIKTNGYLYAMGKADFSKANFHGQSGIINDFYTLCQDSRHSVENGIEFIKSTVLYIEESLSRYR